MKDNTEKLGRGILELMEENDANINDNEEVIEVLIEDIKPNPDQPRTIFDETSLQELSESIKEHGVFQPVILKPAGTGFMLVAGERRVKASMLAGKTTIPAIIRDYNQVYLSELAILENLQREDLTPIEEAIAFQKAVHNLKITHGELAKKIGKSRAYVTNIIGLLKLPKIVIDNVNLGIISMGHARALSKIADEDLLLDLHNKIIIDNLTVRDIERLIRNIGKQEKSAISSSFVSQKKKTLDNFFGKEIKYSINKNQLVFRYDNENELQKIIDNITGGKRK